MEITEAQFLAAKGIYNFTYVIQLRVTFIKLSGVAETLRANANIRWVSVPRPVFNFNLPYRNILVTAE